MRRLLTFACAGESLVATLDAAAGTTGLLIVSGGNEIRCGAHRGMALLAARLAAAGIPVLRYDRRGIGDSTGENAGFAASRDDIVAAAATFRAEAPHLVHLAAFGNCDAATALALFHTDARIDSLILANPWVIEDAGALPPAAAIRARYADRLRDPGTYWRLLRGGVNIGKLFKGLAKLSQTPSKAPDGLSTRLQAALTASAPATIVLATRDATALAFADAIDTGALTLHRIETASHSFAGETTAEALAGLLIRTLAPRAPSPPSA